MCSSAILNLRGKCFHVEKKALLTSSRPALVNIASFRLLIAFGLAFKVSSFIIDYGYIGSNMIYLGIIAFFAATLPIIFFYGPAMRRRWPGPDR